MSIELVSADGTVEVVTADNATPAKATSEAKESEAAGDKDAATETVEESDPSKKAAEKVDDDEDDDDFDDGDEDKETDQKPPKKKGGFKKRIERFQRQLIERELEIERLKREALERQPPNKEQNPEKPAAENQFTRPKPKSEDFDTNEEFVENLTDWKLEQRDAKVEASRRADEIKTRAQESQKTFMEKLDTFRKTAPDWDDVIGDVSDLLIPATVTAEVEKSGPELMYALAKDRETLERMTKLPTVDALQELGAFKAKISQSKPAAEEAKPAKQTAAPAPLTPVNGKTTARKKTIYDEDLSMAEYEELRMKSKRA